MSRRRWAWAGGLAVLGAIDLAATLRAHAGWQQPAGDSQATLSLGQLIGFVSSVLLLAVAAAIVVTGVRSWRTRRRQHRLAARIEPRDSDLAG